MSHLASLLALSAVAAAAAAAARAGDFGEEWRTWHERRVGALREPFGWLSLVGLHWLEQGPNRIPGLPGTFVVEGAAVRLAAAPGDGWTLGGKPVAAQALASDATEAPDRLVNGSRAAMVISRGDALALRVWDSESAVRKDFKGVDAFPPDPRWRIEARWEAYPEPRQVEQPTAAGAPSRELAPGQAVFAVGGREVSLEPTLEGDSLFFVFKDATAPRETYGGGRFLRAKAPSQGTVVLDFNRAYNPPCVFTPYATCPLALPRNTLPVRIEAGEKVWGAH